MAPLWAQAHPYARRVLRERGLTPGDIRTVDDIRKLPPMSKQDYIRDPESFSTRSVPSNRSEPGRADYCRHHLHGGFFRRSDTLL